MLVLDFTQAKNSIPIKFFFERKASHQRVEAYYQNGFTTKNFEHNVEPVAVIPHVPENWYLACYMHWIGTDRPQKIAIFDTETKEEINKFFAARRKENAGIAWYYVPQGRYEILKKEIEDMQKAQAEKMRLARAREQRERTAKLAKILGEKEKLVLSTNDDFDDKKSESCCCSCWWG